MKKYVILILLMFFPFIVSAETCDTSSVEIKKVEVVSTNGNASENTSAKVNNKTIGLDLSMNHVDDSITYKITVKNNSNNDFEINNNLNSNSKYIDYSFEGNDSNIIKAKSTKEINIKALYKSEVPATLLNNGIFNEKDNVVLSLSTLSNPKTGFIIPSVLVIIGITGLICYMILKKNFKPQTLIIVFALLLMIPYIIHAECSVNVEIKSNIDIKKLAIFDTGLVVNEKMNILAGNNEIHSFKRSNTLPDDILNAIREGKSAAQSVTISDQEITQIIDLAKSRATKISDLNIEKDLKGNHYCYKEGFQSTYCIYVDDIILNDDTYTKIYYLDNSKFLIYNLESFEYDVYTEEEYRNYLKNKQLKLKKNEYLKNIISSSSSDYEIYSWYDENTIYYYTNVDDVYLNKDSSYMFFNLDYLTEVPGIENVKATTLENANFMFSRSSYYADKFILDLSSWNTSNVKTMKGMFAGRVSYSTTWNGNVNIKGLSNFNTSNVKDMSFMFANAGYKSRSVNFDLSGFNTSNVTDMSYMFANSFNDADSFNLGDISNWDTSNVIDMSFMFCASGNYANQWYIGKLDKWDTSNVENMSGMFKYSGGNIENGENVIIDLSNFNTSNVKDMSYMFESFKGNEIGNIDRWDTSNVENMSRMFYYYFTDNLGNIKNWNVSKVKDMSFMFRSFNYTSGDINLDLSSWNTSSVTNMDSMFLYFGDDCESAIKINLSNMNVSKVENMNEMFYGVGNMNTTSIELDLTGWNTNNLNNIIRMFSGFGRYAQTVKILGLSDFKTSKVTQMDSVFASCARNASSFKIDLSRWDTSKVKSMTLMFYNNGVNSTEWSVGDLSNWNTSSLLYTRNMFYSAGNNSEVWNIGDLSNWNLSSLNDATSMFEQAGYHSTTWNSIGTLNLYDVETTQMFRSNPNVKATIKLHKKLTKYNYMFSGSSISSGALITVDYASEVDNIDNIIATKSSNSNVVKGSLIE